MLFLTTILFKKLIQGILDFTHDITQLVRKNKKIIEIIIHASVCMTTTTRSRVSDKGVSFVTDGSRVRLLGRFHTDISYRSLHGRRRSLRP